MSREEPIVVEERTEESEPSEDSPQRGKKRRLYSVMVPISEIGPSTWKRDKMDVEILSNVNLPLQTRNRKKINKNK
jgi:hypothetical protein